MIMRQVNKAMTRYLGIAVIGLCLSTGINAKTPVWTYSSPSPAQVTVSTGSTATVSYTVINQSSRSKNLILRTPHPGGLSVSPCYLAGKGSTCALILTLNGSQLPKKGLNAGPVLCE